MSDDFEADLRRRLADLAASSDQDRPWEDPLPAARTGTGPLADDDAGVVVPLDRARRRRLLPTAAAAAVVAALLVGGGFGLRALTRGSGGSSGAASVAGPADGGAETGGAGDRVQPGGGSAPSAAGGGSADGPGSTGSEGGCTGDATSTGPLASVATIRSSGIVAPRTSPGGTAAVSYQLTFGQAGGTAQVRAASVVLVRDGALCPAGGTAGSGAIQAVPVEPGAGQSGTATFVAVDGTGATLPAGTYQVAVVIPYSVDGSASSQLVSPPLSVTVTS